MHITVGEVFSWAEWSQSGYRIFLPVISFTMSKSMEARENVERAFLHFSYFLSVFYGSKALILLDEYDICVLLWFYRGGGLFGDGGAKNPGHGAGKG